MIRRLFAFVAALAVLDAASAFAQAPSAATVTPMVSTTGVVLGGTVDIAVRVSLPEGLHSQSNKPKDDALVPTTLTFLPTSGLAPKEVVFPPAHDFKLDTGDTLLVFEGDFVIGARVAVDRTALQGAITLTAKLRYQPCNNTMCFRPVTIPVSWSIPVSAQAGLPMAANIFAAIPFGKGDPATMAADDTTTTPATTAAPTAAPASLDDFAVAGTAGGYMNVETFLAFVHDAERGVTSKGMFADQGPLAILLLIFVGGLALNLTPCVLPMIPINLAIIGAGAQSTDKSRGFILGLAYGAAMAVAYGVLGLIVILTAGTFGTINALTHGGPGKDTETLVLKVYRDGIVNQDIGSSSAQSVILMLGVIAITAIQFRFMGRRTSA